MENKTILYESEDAMQYKTNICGFVDRHGRYWGKDEHMARWSGCTHIKCACGNMTEKSFTICEECRDKKKNEKYNAMPFKEWDKEGMLYSNVTDKYFDSIEEILDYCTYYDCNPESLQLIICKEDYIKPIDPYDCLSGYLPDDYDLPKDIIEAFDELNKKINNSKISYSYVPGKYRTNIKDNYEG